jgi:hypothetical protein
MAKRWEKETPRNAKLPERATKKRRRRNSSIMAALEEGARRLGR